jgi:hypothetical protein
MHPYPRVNGQDRYAAAESAPVTTAASSAHLRTASAPLQPPSSHRGRGTRWRDIERDQRERGDHHRGHDEHNWQEPPQRDFTARVPPERGSKAQPGSTQHSCGRYATAREETSPRSLIGALVVCPVHGVKHRPIHSLERRRYSRPYEPPSAHSRAKGPEHRCPSADHVTRIADPPAGQERTGAQRCRARG